MHLRSVLLLSTATVLVAPTALAQLPPQPPSEAAPAAPPSPWRQAAQQPPPSFVPPQAPPPPVEPLPLPPPAVAYGLSPAPAEAWHSGYHNGNFYIRSSDDVFRLYVMARVHVDYYQAFGPGLNELAPRSAPAHGFELRRARLEMAGEFFNTWQWWTGVEFAPSAASNVAGNTGSLSCKVSATTSALTCTPVEAAVDAPSVSPAPTDVFVNYAPSPWANVQVGQFYLPFTLENRISDNTTAFLERALVVRDVGAPTQRDLGAMFWGESPNRVLYYSAGIFNGDGPNRPNADNRYDFAGRAFVRPFATVTSSPTKWAQIGVSAHLGSRDPTKVGYDMPAMTTAEGFAFWKPTYTDSYGRLIHILPSATQQAVGADLYLPIGGFDLTGEVVYADYETREAVDGLQNLAVHRAPRRAEGLGILRAGRVLARRQSRDPRLLELRPAHPRRPLAAAAAGAAWRAARGARRAARHELRGCVARRPGRFEDAERGRERYLFHPRGQLLGDAAPARERELRLLRPPRPLRALGAARSVLPRGRPVLTLGASGVRACALVLRASDNARSQGYRPPGGRIRGARYP